MGYNLRERISIAIKLLANRSLPERTRREVPAITPEEVAEARAFFPREKFFIFGHARSGTTLLARLVRLHPEVHCNWQAHFFTRLPLLESLVADPEVGSWLSRGSNRWNRGRDLSPVVLRAAADFVLERDARKEGKPIVGDKSPSSLLDGESVKLLHKVYPDARLITIVRDGRDTVLSHLFQGFIETPQNLSEEDQRIRAEFIHDPQPFLRGERSIFTEAGIYRAAQGWVRNVGETDQLGKDLYGARYMALRYEDLLTQTWDEMIRVWIFLAAGSPEPGLNAEIAQELHQNLDSEWQMQKASEIASALQKGKRGTWREMFTSRDRRVFQEIAGETLQVWGYEESG